MAEPTEHSGFAPPKPKRMLTRRHTAVIELIATVTLTLSLIVAATAVSLANKPLLRAGLHSPSAPIVRQ